MKRITFWGILLMLVISTSGLAAAQEPTPGPDEEEATFITLTEYDQSMEEAVAELEELGVIPSGGGEIFREPYAYFEGTGWKRQCGIVWRTKRH